MGEPAEVSVILRFDVVEDITAVRTFGLLANIRRKADARLLRAVQNDLLEAGEGTAANEKNVGRIDLQKLLLRMLASTLRGYGCDRAFDQLQQCLLDTFARNIAGDRRVVRLA